MPENALTAAAGRLDSHFDGSGERGIEWLADRGLAISDLQLYVRAALPAWVEGNDLTDILTLALATGYMLGVEDEQNDTTIPTKFEGSE